MRQKQKSAKIVQRISAILAVVFVFQVFTAFYTDNNKTQETKKSPIHIPLYRSQRTQSR